MSDTTPHFLSGFDRSGFMAWLERNGATLVEATNPYEVLRYRMWVPDDKGRKSTHIIYKRKNNTLTYQGHSRTHYAAFSRKVPA